MPRPSLRRPRRSALRVEHLEDRSVPAGNVTANILTDPDGFRTLYLQGDTADNRVTLRQLPTGVLQVHGVSTSINGGKGVVSFANVRGLVASFSTGNDTVRTTNLNMQTVYLDGGFGDDDLSMQNTTLADGIRDASLFVTGDPDTTVVPPDTLVNGRDKIELTGTRISSGGQYAPMTILGDSIEDLDTPDDIRLTDTRLTFHGAGYHLVSIYGGSYGYGESRGSTGDTITVTNFRSEAVGGGEYTTSGLYVQGSSGDDTIRFTGLDLTLVGTGGSNYTSLDVLGTGGFDRLDATDVTVTATGPADSYQYYYTSFWCEDIRFRDWDVTVTSQFDVSSPFGQLPFQPSFRGVHNLELRDVRMTTPEGGGFISIDSMDPDTGEDGFATNILFDNVQIDEEVEGMFGLGCLYESYSGDDTVRILNSRLPNFGVLKYGTDGSADVLIEGSELGGLGLTLGEWDYLAEATDTVRIRNSTIRDRASILTYGGNDTIEVSDSMFGGRLNVEGGAGDDGITITGCTFTGSPQIDIMGDSGFESFYSAAGNDTIRVTGSTLDAQDPDGEGTQGWISIVGDYIDGPETFVGGNDVIEVSDITATASSSAYSDLFVSVSGASVSGGGTLIGGDDDITVRNVRLHSAGVGADSFATASFDVSGGIVNGNGTLVGDNTIIRVQDLEVVADGDGGSEVWAQVAGEWTFTDYESGDLPTVIGGNDVIDVANCDFRSGGSYYTGVFGERGLNQLRVVGGNDVISLTDVTVVSADPFGFGVGGDIGQFVDSSGLSDTITLTNVSLRQVSPVPDGYGYIQVDIMGDEYGGAGDDRVTLDNFTTGIVGEGQSGTERVSVILEGGNDEVVIRNSRSLEFVVTLGDGDDAATLTGVETERLSLWGGVGDDELTVRDSTFTGTAPEVSIAGDYPSGFPSAAGNDTIRVTNCTLDAQDPDGVGVFGLVLIIGDVVNGPGMLVGGNDVIEVTGFTAIVSSTADYSDLFIGISGESVSGGATLIGGHDEITIQNMNLNVVGVGPSSYASAALYVTGGGVDGDSTLVGSDDTIRVRDVSIITDGATDPNVGFNFSDVQIVGTFVFTDFFSDERPTIVGGNDVIEVTNGHFQSSGIVTATFAGEFGYGDLSITGGNDIITLTDVATTSGFGHSLIVGGEYVYGDFIDSSGLADTITMKNVSAVHVLEGGVEFGNAELYVIGYEGDNLITLDQVMTAIVGSALDSYEVMSVEGANGDNVVSIRESSSGGQFFVNLGNGDDTLTVADSAFATTRISLGGGDDTADITGLTTTDLDLRGETGDDELNVRNSTFTGSAVNVMVAGDYPNDPFWPSAAGNDTIRVIDSALRPDVGGSATMFIFGDNISGSEAGNTFVGGNDVIELDRLTFAGGSSSTYYVSVIGDYVDGGTLIGGDDTITVRKLSADNTVPADFGYVNLEIFGDLVGAAVIVGGNDAIRLVDWALDLGATGSFMDVAIYGDYANGWDGTETEARAYVGGNDVIDLADIHLSGLTFGPIVGFQIYGDYLLDRALVGGNDEITVSNFTASFDVFYMNINCDQVESYFFQSSISGGNDTVSVTGLRYTSANSSVFSLSISTDAWESGLYIDGGHDAVGIDGCQIGESLVDTGGGDDELTVRESTFTSLTADLGDGDDTTVIENNTATTSISVNGGAGWDTLVAWSNVAPDLFFDDFEA